MLAALTGMSLSAAAGLNAYIPFLVVALVARFTDYIVLPVGYEWIESNWAIGIGSVLLVAEVVLDKVPAVDTVNDTIQTFIRPSMGGLIFAASTAASELDQSTWMQENPWVSVVLGVVISGLVHTGKMAARPVINIGTAGTGAPVVSTVEDGASFGLSVLALIAPVLAAHRRPAARVAARLDVAARAPLAPDPARPGRHPDLRSGLSGGPQPSSTTFEAGGGANFSARPHSENTRSDGAVFGPTARRRAPLPSLATHRRAPPSSPST